MKLILLLILLILLSGCSNLPLERDKKIISQPTTKTNMPKTENTNIIADKNDNTKNLVAGKNQKKYKNDKVGISFIYTGNKKSYIKEIDGKLQFINYYKKADEYLPHVQDYIEIYQKNKNDSFKTAVNKIISEKATSPDKCLIEIAEKNIHQILSITYKEKYTFDESKCLPNDEGPKCSVRQIDEHTKNAFYNCSNFEAGPYGNHFIYQPQNTKNKIVFVRHTGGLDAAPWDTTTIKLIESK